MTTKAEAALTYASWGWHVIPVVPNGKVPATQHGVKDATTDPEQITRWWAQNPDFNIDPQALLPDLNARWCLHFQSGLFGSCPVSFKTISLRACLRSLLGVVHRGDPADLQEIRLYPGPLLRD